MWSMLLLLSLPCCDTGECFKRIKQCQDFFFWHELECPSLGVVVELSWVRLSSLLPPTHFLLADSIESFNYYLHPELNCVA